MCLSQLATEFAAGPTRRAPGLSVLDADAVHYRLVPAGHHRPTSALETACDLERRRSRLQQLLHYRQGLDRGQETLVGTILMLPDGVKLYQGGALALSEEDVEVCGL